MKMTYLQMKRCVSYSLILLTCAGCAIPDWIGGSEAKSRLEGDRISLLQHNTSIGVDGAVANQQVEMPQPRRNSRWYKSNGQHSLTEPNPRSPWELETYLSIDAGEGSDDDNYPLAMQPIVAEDRIVVMDALGNVTAYHAANPDAGVVWKTVIQIPEDKINFIQGGLAYDQGRIFVNTGYTTVVALDSKTGEALWKKKLASSTRSAPDARNGQLFVQTLDNKLYALSTTDGTIQWIHAGIEKELTHIGTASPVALSEAVVAAYSSGGLFALRSGTGKQIWEDALSSPRKTRFSALTDIDATPVVSQGRLYTASMGGSLASFELFTGTRVWERDFTSSGGLWVAGNFLYALSEQAELVAFYTLNGGVKWVAALPRYENEEDQDDEIHWSGPVLTGSRLLMVGSHGKMVAISPLSGKIMQQYDIAENVYSPVVAAFGNLYLYDAEAQLHIYSGPKKQPTMDDFVTIEHALDGIDGEFSLEEEGTVEKVGTSVGDFFTGILKRFKAEPEDDAEPDAMVRP